MPTDLPPGYTGQDRPKDKPGTTWAGLLGLLIICATLVLIVWMLTR